MSLTTTTKTEQRALELLGSGLSPEVVASAVGVTPARISQLLSDENFANQVTELRYKTLSAHNQRDSHYDSIEDTLLSKLEKSIPLMCKPGELLGAIKVINGAKRRGQSTPEHITNQQTVVQINLPQVAVEKFITNSANQVVKAGTQELVTIQSGTLLKEIRQAAVVAATTRQGVENDALIEGAATVSSSEESNRDTSYEAAATRFKQEASRLGAAINFIPVGS